jgi:hypothetical protein
MEASSGMVVQLVARTRRIHLHSTHILVMPRNPHHYQIYHNMSMNGYHMVFQHNIHYHHETAQVLALVLDPWLAVCMHQNMDHPLESMCTHQHSRTYTHHRYCCNMTTFVVNFQHSILLLLLVSVPEVK